jgi:dTDP-glucose 4,6-dehydratase
VRSNLSVVEALCAAFDRLRPERAPHARLITFVADRPGHDRRYAIDPGKAEGELGWAPRRGFEAALFETVAWYLDNADWWRPIREGRYRGERLGLAPVRKAPASKAPASKAPARQAEAALEEH